MTTPFGLSITGDEIANWASQIEASSILPQLVRRLIQATSPIQSISFRADGGVRYGGWDGFVVAAAQGALPFVPSSASFWELSSTASTAGKLEDDYKKRSGETVTPIAPSAATYVAVTARRFSGKLDWARERQAEGHWADVRCLDADDISTWLESAPAVAAWFATEHLNRPIADVSSVSDYLNTWSHLTDPPLPLNLHLLGRERTLAIEKVRQWTNGPATRLMVRAETLDNARYFVAATIAVIPELEQALGRAVVVHSETALRWALRHPPTPPLVVIPTFDATARLLNSAHHVLSALGPTTPGSPHIVLGAVPFRLLQPELERAGFQNAGRLASDSRGSLSALARLCGAPIEPTWAQSPSRTTLAFLLVGQWRPNSDADRDAFSTLAHETAAAIETLCAELSRRPENPVRIHHGRFGTTTWQWSSPGDAWESLAPHITLPLLQDFRELALRVLSEADPKYTMAPEERFYAGIQGKVRTYSAELREGIAQTLCRLSFSDDSLRSVPGGRRGTATAASIVRELLKKDWLAWASLSDVLPLLAEAAPTEFLDALDQSLDAGVAGVSHLFVEEGEYTAPHTGLLWALERLGWAPDRMARVAHALARLAENDPGGRMANRPASSLHRLLHAFCPSTNATVQDRMAFLRELHNRRPKLAWDVTIDLLESFSGGVAFPAARPEFLQERCEERTGTYADLFHVVEVTNQLLLAQIGADVPRWKQLLAECNIPSDMRLPFLREAERRIRAGELRDDDQHTLWNALRTALHRAYIRNEEDSAEDLKILNLLYRSLAPGDPVDRFAWLFGPHAQVPEGFGVGGWREEQTRLATLQQQALCEILDHQNKLVLCQRLAEVVGAPHLLGFLLGKLQRTLGEPLETELAEGTSSKWRRIRPAFFAARYATRDKESIAARLAALARAGRLDEAAESALSLPRNDLTWDALVLAGAEVNDAYWKAGGFSYPLDESGTERSVAELLRVGSVVAAVTVAGAHPTQLSARTIAELLRRFAELPPEERRGDSMSSHYVGELFKRLHADTTLTANDVVKLEIAYLPWLTGPFGANTELRLYRALEEQPELFAQLVHTLYRGDNDVADEADDQRANFARTAHHVLHGWKSHPGRDLGDDARQVRLLEWCTQALDLTKIDHRERVAEAEIARILARVPVGSDGVWPCKAARELIEKRGQSLRDGVSLAKRNLRGMVTKEMYEGGKQERDLAAQFRAGASKLRPDGQWPQTIALLEDLATQYEAEAEASDAQVKSEKQEVGAD